jgi:hypothetical protein
MSIGRYGYCWEQHLKEGKARKCRWAKGVVTLGNIQREDMNVHWQIGVLVLLGAAFKGGEDT